MIEANGGKSTPELGLQLLEEVIHGETTTPLEIGRVLDTDLHTDRSYNSQINLSLFKKDFMRWIGVD